VGKRKRRSFYVPESPKMRAWLDNQKDLGLSLQVLIRDALERYGEGDVAEGYIRKYIAEGDAQTTPVATDKVKVDKVPVDDRPPQESDDDTHGPVIPAQWNDQEKTEEPEETSTDDTDDYDDPLSVMFQDIGSQWAK